MAISTTPGTTPATGGLDYTDYQKDIEQAAAKTKTVAGPAGLPAGTEDLLKRLKGTPGEAQAQAAISQYRTQKKTTQQQAEKAGTALEMVGESTTQGMQNLEAIQAGIKKQVASASESFGAAAEKADEYVQAARGRVGQVLDKLDETFKEFGRERNFAKAHAMQASVQAVVGSMKTEERNIAETYGTDSKEMEQFQASKQSSLATIQSNLHASYEQLAETQQNAYLNVMSDSYTKSNMYVGFQEQQHVEMLKYKTEAENAYTLQAAQANVAIEQMKMAGMENLANWLVETPTFSMDSTPLMTLIADLIPQPGGYISPEKTIAQRYAGVPGVSSLASGGIRVR